MLCVLFLALLCVMLLLLLMMLHGLLMRRYVVAPSPTGATNITIQTGLNIKRLDGTIFKSYNATVDASISTQYIDDWNEYQVGWM
jgi:hypothetical protein